MTTSLSSAKRVRQNAKRKLRNRQKASAVKTAMRKLDKAVAAKDPKAVSAAVAEAYKRIDKAAGGALHHKTAARRKSLVARMAGAALKG